VSSSSWCCCCLSLSFRGAEVEGLTEEEDRFLRNLLKYYLNREYSEWMERLYRARDGGDWYTYHVVVGKLDLLESIMRKLGVWVE